MSRAHIFQIIGIHRNISHPSHVHHAAALENVSNTTNAQGLHEDSISAFWFGLIMVLVIFGRAVHYDDYRNRRKCGREFSAQYKVITSKFASISVLEIPSFDSNLAIYLCFNFSASLPASM